LSFLGFQVVDVRTHILWAPTASTTNSTFNYARDIARARGGNGGGQAIDPHDQPDDKGLQ